MVARTPTEVLAASRRETSVRKRQQVMDAVQRMLHDAEPISFTAVARAAEVSTWRVYVEGVREHVLAAIQRQEQAPVTATADGRRATTRACTPTWPWPARRSKNSAQNAITFDPLRQHLGHQLDQISNRSLTERINELTPANRKLEHEQAHLRPLADHVQELERDLAATRTSLRQMIRERALEPGPNGAEGPAWSPVSTPPRRRSPSSPACSPPGDARR